jgi:hypothetical protein
MLVGLQRDAMNRNLTLYDSRRHIRHLPTVFGSVLWWAVREWTIFNVVLAVGTVIVNAEPFRHHGISSGAIDLSAASSSQHAPEEAIGPADRRLPQSMFPRGRR